MNSLIQNYEIILKELTATCADIPCFHQTRKPKLSGLELIALNLTAEFMMYNSEEQLFRGIKHSYLEGKIERSVYTRRRKKLFDYTGKIRRQLCRKFSSLSNLFIVGSSPKSVRPSVPDAQLSCRRDHTDSLRLLCYGRNPIFWLPTPRRL